MALGRPDGPASATPGLLRPAASALVASEPDEGSQVPPATSGASHRCPVVP